MRSIALFSLLGGCRAQYPLPEVPVLGGTEEERALLQLELAAYEAMIGPGRVRLRYVEIVDQIHRDETLAGLFEGDDILVTRSSNALTYTLRHELCHAVDAQEGLVNRAAPLFDEFAAGLFSEVLSVESRLAHYPTAPEQRREALAEACEYGPMALAAMLEPCPGESPLAKEIAEWLLDEVYTEYPLLPPVVLDPTRATTLDAWVEGIPTVSPTTEPGVVLVGEDFDWQRAANLYTGRLLDERPVTTQVIREGPLARGMFRFDEAGWPDGPAAVHGLLSMHHLRSGERLFVYDAAAEAWRMVQDGCTPPKGETLFTSGGEVWRSWTEGDVLRWMPLSVPAD